MTQAAPEVYTETITPLQGGDPVSFRMIKVEGGEFWMGSEDKEVYSSEKPIHRVKLSTYWIGEFPVTQALWVAVMGDNPAYFPGMDRPIENVSWVDITERFLPALRVLTNSEYRLPTEAEWEFAARGGIYHSPYKYAGSNRLEDVGWNYENSHRETKSVGLKQPNALGLYDMSGNIYEWCADHWHDNYHGAPIDGSAWIEKDDAGRDRVLRGGSWLGYDPWGCRVSSRDDAPEDADYFRGFRLEVSSWQ